VPQESFENLHAEMVGEIERKVLVIKRIRQIFRLTADGSDRKIRERVLEVYADSFPVAASVKGSLEISSELDLTVA
jgi:hypothetical protein